MVKLRRMSADQYAHSLRTVGERLTDRDGIWWREVRPFFFRPLLPYTEVPGVLKAPNSRAKLGGYQYAVPEPAAANSVMALLIFPGAGSYSLDQLNSDRRRGVRTAAKHFEVRPFADPHQFSVLAHPVYVSFYQRTHYRVYSARLDPGHFRQWANAIFSEPGSTVLGAFQGDSLAAVNISRVVGDTLHYSTFFATEDAMKRQVSSLMLHTVRALAAESGDIRQIFAGMRKSGRAESVDTFYLHRGCSLEAKPARLCLNPMVRLGLRVVQPHLLNRLTGSASAPTAGAPMA